MPPDGPEEWPIHMSKRQWLVFYRINGMAMQGGGVIDGRGQKWWNLPCKPHKVYVKIYRSKLVVNQTYKILNALRYLIS